MKQSFYFHNFFYFLILNIFPITFSTKALDIRTLQQRKVDPAKNSGHHAAGEQQGQTKQTKKETCSGQKPKVRWPGASEVKEWNCINVDLKGILEGLKGTVESKRNCMGEVIYNYGMERYGVCQKARKEKQGQAGSLRNMFGGERRQVTTETGIS